METFQYLFPKTDEVRIQSEPKLLEKLHGKPFYITVKLDGTSATYYKQGEHFGVCSRNLELKDGDNKYWEIAHRYKIHEWLPDGYYIQGELCGPTIQKNRLQLDDFDLFVFNIGDFRMNRVSPFILDNENGVRGVVRNPLIPHDLKLVPLESYDLEFHYTQEELLELAKGFYKTPGKPFRREGIVVRSFDQTVSFKVVNNDYLLKDEE